MPVLFRITLGFLLKLWTLPAPAQQRLATNQERYGVEQGLAQSLVSDMVQDADGFMWFATHDGLSRYDGRGFKNFLYNSKAKGGLSGNSIYNLIQHSNNQLTVLYDGFRADDLNMRTGEVRRNTILDKLGTLPGALRKLHHRDHTYNGKRWLFLQNGYNGIGWLNAATGAVSEANRANGRLVQDTLSAFLLTPDNRLYLVSENGVQVSGAAETQFSNLPFATGIKPVQFLATRDQQVVLPPLILLSGNRLALLQNDTLMILDLTRRRVRKYPLPPAANPNGPDYSKKLKTDAAGRFYFNHKGRIFRMKEEGKFDLLWENTQRPELSITSFYIDRTDVLWVSVSAQGLLKVDLRVLPFFSYGYRANFVQEILQQAGIPAGWAASAQAYHFRYAYDANGILNLSCNLLDNNNLYRWNGSRLTAQRLAPTPTIYWAMAAVPGGGLKVFEDRKLLVYNLKPGVLEPQVSRLSLAAFKDARVTDARFVSGDLWMTTVAGGLFQLRGDSVVAHYAGPQPGGYLTEELTEICPDPTDPTKFWIGSRGGGLILWHTVRGLQRVYTTEDGLPNNTVYCMLPDKAGNIWGSTNKGIFRFNVRTGTVTSFAKTEGLPGNEFNRAHKFLFPDGRMGFGGLDGYTVFNPADFEKPPEIIDAPVQLTALQVNNQEPDLLVPQGKETLATLDRLELPYNQNNVSVTFAAMAFNQPQKTLYRYRLLGADTTWVEAGNNNQATYAALSPGQYRLEVAATNNAGQWSRTVRKLSIVIRPPFWATWWAYAVYAALAALAIRYYLATRERRIQVAQQLAFEKKEALRLRELESLKERFFSNITHEFRTPLTLITAPLEKLHDEGELAPPAKKLLGVAQKNAAVLLRLINEFLDISKLHNGHMQVKLSTGDLALYLTEAVRTFEAGAEEKGLQLALTVTGVEGMYDFDPEKWEKILFNLLSNALKFTPAGGRILVTLSAAEGDTVALGVSNTGPGIPAAERPRVFDRFYQVDGSSTRTSGGTGIGLALVKELAELMGGEVELDSTAAGLTVFTVIVPVQKVLVALLPDAGPVEKSAKSVGKAAANAPLVMVVEDSEELRHFLVENLERRYRVVQAADGLQAWDLALKELPDAILSDVMMPGRDGFDLCHLVKTDMRTAHICFVLLTSKAAQPTRLQGLRTGADDYVTKPFHLAELEQRIANLLQQQQKTRTHLRKQLLPAAPSEAVPSIDDAFLKTLYAAMDAKLDDPGLDVETLSRSVTMSRSTLNRKLKAVLDVSANELIRQYRLQRAAALLTTGADVAGVAYRVGFSSPSYFTQCFREQFSLTPTEYLAEVAKKDSRAV